MENGGRLRWLASNIAAVAQRIRASVYGTEGRGFESLQPHHYLKNSDTSSRTSSRTIQNWDW
jgi:hypothetical protein